jgi:hypothetical protein
MTTTKHLVESMIQNWINETYAVTHKGQPFAYFDTEAEAKKHMEKYAKKGDASSYKVVKEERLTEEGFVTVSKRDRGYLPRWKKRKEDEWKDYRISHFPTEKAAREWLKRDNPDAVFESLEEASDYKVMHKSFTDAVNTAKEKAEKAGYTIDDDEWFRKVSSGPRKPGTDKTNRYTVELLTKKGNDAKKALHFQVYNTGGSYELNAYIN